MATATASTASARTDHSVQFALFEAGLEGYEGSLLFKNVSNVKPIGRMLDAAISQTMQAESARGAATRIKPNDVFVLPDMKVGETGYHADVVVESIGPHVTELMRKQTAAQKNPGSMGVIHQNIPIDVFFHQKKSGKFVVDSFALEARIRLWLPPSHMETVAETPTMTRMCQAYIIGRYGKMEKLGKTPFGHLKTAKLPKNSAEQRIAPIGVLTLGYRYNRPNSLHWDPVKRRAFNGTKAHMLNAQHLR